jgi:hypothetical protein
MDELRCTLAQVTGRRIRRRWRATSRPAAERLAVVALLTALAGVAMACPIHARARARRAPAAMIHVGGGVDAGASTVRLAAWAADAGRVDLTGRAADSIGVDLARRAADAVGVDLSLCTTEPIQADACPARVSTTAAVRGVRRVVGAFVVAELAAIVARRFALAGDAVARSVRTCARADRVVARRTVIDVARKIDACAAAKRGRTA